MNLFLLTDVHIQTNRVINNLSSIHSQVPRGDFALKAVTISILQIPMQQSEGKKKDSWNVCIEYLPVYLAIYLFIHI